MARLWHAAGHARTRPAPGSTGLDTARRADSVPGRLLGSMGSRRNPCRDGPVEPGGAPRTGPFAGARLPVSRSWGGRYGRRMLCGIWQHVGQSDRQGLRAPRCGHRAQDPALARATGKPPSRPNSLACRQQQSRHLSVPALDRHARSLPRGRKTGSLVAQRERRRPHPAA